MKWPAIEVGLLFGEEIFRGGRRCVLWIWKPGPVEGGDQLPRITAAEGCVCRITEWLRMEGTSGGPFL